MNNKAQGNTFWIVITAIVALVVLVILIIIFTGKTNLLGAELLNCESKGGFCTASGTTNSAACTSACVSNGYDSCSYSSAFTCKSTTTPVCCLGVKEVKK